MPPAFVRGFGRLLDSAASGPAFVREREIVPVKEVPRFSGSGEPASAAERKRTAAVILNGGLGTTMGMRAPKCLLRLASGMTFLDLALKQAESAGVRPLLMNSFATEAPVREALGNKRVGVFLQHLAPKLRRSDLHPVSIPENPALAWCPPGHGDLYTALGTSGMLEGLLAEGFRTLFVSNVDNAGGSPDPVLLRHFLRSGAPFLMEVVRRTRADWKGGHLARRRTDGRLILRETAQCSPEERSLFEDPGRYRFFNANNLWISLPALAAALEQTGGFLPLPVIVNPKTADPENPRSTPVYHLEQAAGTALEVFPDARAVEVPRSRFAPVKTTSDLLLLRSDAWRIEVDGRAKPVREPLPRVELDSAYYRFLADLEARFPEGSPSLATCSRLRVEGDVTFGGGVICEGEVIVKTRPGRPARISGGAFLQGEVVPGFWQRTSARKPAAAAD